MHPSKKIDSKNVFNVLRIAPTEIRVEILQIFLNQPGKEFTAKEIYTRIGQGSKISICLSSVTATLALFRVRKILLEKPPLATNQKPGRPTIQFYVSQAFLDKYYIASKTSLYCL